MNYLYVEFLGTLLHALSTLLVDNPLFVGLFLALLMYSFGGFFNPALTLIEVTKNKLTMKHALKMIGTQLLAGLTAYQLSKYVVV